MANVIYWIEVCGNVTEDDAFWSDGLTVNTSSPDLTRCFQKTLLSAAPCLYLWLACVIYVPYLCMLPTVNAYRDISSFNIFKSVLCGLLVVITTANLVSIAIHHIRYHPHHLGDFLQQLILFVTYILAGVVNYYEYKKAVHSGGVLFFFWGLTVIFNIIPFRSNILHIAYDQSNKPQIDELFVFITFYIAYAVQLVQFFCTLFSDLKALPWMRRKRDLERQPILGETHGEVEKNPCPEKTAPYWQRVSFLWVTRLIIQGYKRTLDFKDLWGLMPGDKCDVVITDVMKQWEKEVQKTNFRMVTKHREDLSISQSGKSDPGVSQSEFLISSREHQIKPETPLKSPELAQKSSGGFRQYSLSYKMKSRAKEKKTKLPSFWSVIVRVFGSYYMLGGFYNFVYTLFNFVSPQLLNLLITFIANGDPYVWKGYLYVILLFAVSQFKSFFNQHYWHCCYVVGLRLRTAVIGVVYRKSLRLNNASKSQSTVGEIVNLMSVDAQKLQDVPGYLHLLWGAPLTIAIALYFLWQQLGPSVLTGFGFMLLLVPVNAVIAQKTRKLQIKQMILKDQRLKLMNEVLNGVKVLKLYAWENSFRGRILGIRERELVTLQKAQYLSAGSALSWFMAPYLVALGSFATFTLSSPNNVLDANKAFVSLSLFNIMNFPMSMLPGVIAFGVQASVSIGRINKFLRNEELDPDNVTDNLSGDSTITVQNGTFSWGKDLAPTLRGINLKIPEGKLVAVVGQVGSGKSSLISALLGEMEVMLGSVRSRGSVAYVPQQAWIQNASLQDNILFGREKTEYTYQKVIDSCALTPDLQILPGGDQIEIGEKGINLSGGQKQRVSLARAVYQNSDVYLLDDPLSAVDAHVGKHIFENVIGDTGMLKHKTRVLVTNAVNYLPKTDLIVCLKDGMISEVGPYEELLCQEGSFAEYIEAYLKEASTDDSDDSAEMSQFKSQLKQQMSFLSGSDYNDDGTEGDTEADSDKPRSSRRGSLSAKSAKKRVRKSPKKSVSILSDKELIQKEEKKIMDKKLTEEEAVMSGRVSFGVFKAWIKSCGLTASCLTIFFYLIYLGTQAAANIWLSQWSNDPPTVNGTQDIDQRNLRLGVYGGIGALQAIGTLGQAFSMAVATVCSSRVLHHRLLLNILRAPMSFFDTTPLGRIINRFSKDVDTLDVNIPLTLRIWLGTMSTVITTLFVISYSTPLFLVVMVPLSIFYFFVQRFYVTTSRQLRRIDSIKRSPIYVHFSESITGASSVRAYKQLDRFMQKSDKLVDENQMAYYPNIVSNRWLGITLDFIGNLIVLFSGLFAVLQRETISPGLAGLSVTYALQITTTLNVWVRMTSDLENYIVAVERIQEYTDCPKEAPAIVEGNRPGFGWPTHGQVQFERYATRYRPGLDLVLENVECEIRPGEQLGVVGRTGAGKSSLTLALFRIIEAAIGKISIDGVNIANIGLQDLRSRITIIPQDPVLFSGTLRMNLDPFEQYSDDEVWGALELSHLKDFVQSIPTGLSYVCAEGGENLSVGQRQLVCLARALLRKTKILVLDEATAAVDLETDDLIQTTIRTEFKKSTVITIAHRINTIMDYDRIMVLDKGKIVEMDTPSSLLENASSIFHSMASNAGLI